jgi:hypothetical protein
MTVQARWVARSVTVEDRFQYLHSLVENPPLKNLDCVLLPNTLCFNTLGATTTVGKESKALFNVNSVGDG